MRSNLQFYQKYKILKHIWGHFQAQGHFSKDNKT